MQNFAARILTNTKKNDHIPPILNGFGWLSIEELLSLRNVTMIYNIDLAPTYLAATLFKRSETFISLTNKEA